MRKSEKKKKNNNNNLLAERGFDPRTSGLWAQHASTAPLCFRHKNILILGSSNNGMIFFKLFSYGLLYIFYKISVSFLAIRLECDVN